MKRWRGSSGIWAVFALFGALLLFLPQSGSSQCASLKDPNSPRQGEQIHFQAGSGIDSTLIVAAIEMWQSGCPGDMGVDFPTLQSGGSGGASYTVVLEGHNGSDAHCGEFSASLIRLYTSSTDQYGNRQDCGNRTMNLAHEMGHVLGLADAPRSQNCEHNIMSWITRNNGGSRVVRSEECAQADLKWNTATELSGDRGGDGFVVRPCV